MSTISAGTTLTTALVQTGDTTGELVIKTNNGNTTAATFTTAGNVGIGTSSPNEAITVQREAGASAAITIRGNGNSSTSESYVGQGVDNNFYLYNRANYAIVFGTNNTNQAILTNAGLFQFNSGYGSVATAYGCRAWVNFNGTGTVAIRASGNVSSITDNGTGDYTVNFTTAMPDTNYNAVYGTQYSTASVVGVVLETSATTRTVSALQIRAGNANNNTGNDNPIVSVSVFR